MDLTGATTSATPGLMTEGLEHRLPWPFSTRARAGLLGQDSRKGYLCYLDLAKMIKRTKDGLDTYRDKNIQLQQ